MPGANATVRTASVRGLTERVALRDVGRLGYELKADPAESEPDSDVYVLLVDHLVSVTPMSLDLTSRTDLFRLGQLLSGDVKAAPAPPPTVAATATIDTRDAAKAS